MNIDFSEMFSSTGNMLFHGGIIGAELSVVLLIILAPLFNAAKKKMIRKIDGEFKNKGK